MVAALSNSGDAGELRRQALLQVPGCEDGSPPITVAPLQGGTSNAAFRVQTRLGSFVMRLNEPEAAQLGVDRAREVLLHRAAAAAGLAPAIIHADAEGRFLITELITGSIWAASDMGDWRSLEPLCDVLRRLHGLVAPAPQTEGTTPSAPATSPLNLGLLLQHHAANATQARPDDAVHLTSLVRRAESILAASNAGAVRAPSIIHNDLHHSNLIGWGHRLQLVDWEYAAVADPLYDLACLLAYYPQAEPHATRLLEATGLAVRASVEELIGITGVYVLLSYLWYRTRDSLAPASSRDREAEMSLRARLRTPFPF
jgi:thiamine kinase